MLNKDYTFSNYTVNDTNSNALGYAMVVSDLPGSYSPLYIYGEDGTGKSHLLQAIGNCTNTTVEYYSILSSKEDIENIKNIYKDIDVLLLDDYETFRIYLPDDLLSDIIDAYSKENKQVVISSIYKPDELKNINISIINKLNKGTVVKISKPNRQIKIDAIKHRIIELKIRKNFTQQAIDTIINKYVTNLLDIDNILYRIQTCIELYNPYEVDKEFVEKCLKYYNKEEIIPTIVDIVASYYSISTEELLNSNNIHAKVAYWLCKNITKLTSKRIANIIGCDSKQFREYIHEIYEEYDNNEELRKEIRNINRIIMEK